MPRLVLKYFWKNAGWAFVLRVDGVDDVPIHILGEDMVFAERGAACDLAERLGLGEFS